MLEVYRTVFVVQLHWQYPVHHILILVHGQIRLAGTHQVRAVAQLGAVPLLQLCLKVILDGEEQEVSL